LGELSLSVKKIKIFDLCESKFKYLNLKIFQKSEGVDWVTPGVGGTLKSLKTHPNEDSFEVEAPLRAIPVHTYLLLFKGY
jgi:hypothetical protein